MSVTGREPVLKMEVCSNTHSAETAHGHRYDRQRVASGHDRDVGDTRVANGLLAGIQSLLEGFGDSRGRARREHAIGLAAKELTAMSRPLL